MTFYVHTLDGEKHPFDLSDIHDGISKEELIEFVERELELTFFDISYEEPIMDRVIVKIENPCKKINEEEKDYYFRNIECNDMENNIYNFTSFFGHLECLKFAYENRHKDLPENMPGCLQYFKKGETWEVYACKFAAENGHLDCLKYLCENGCKLDEWVCNFASVGGHLECLKYLREIGCDWIKENCLEWSKDHPHIQEYIKSAE